MRHRGLYCVAGFATCDTSDCIVLLGSPHVTHVTQVTVATCIAVCHMTVCITYLKIYTANISSRKKFRGF